MKSKRWAQILEQPPSTPALDKRFAELRFPRVLLDKEFTYAIFEALAQDFNGDIFPIDDEERDRIQQEHLDRLRGFLVGQTSDQENLFFFAYRFDVIPIELISTIYEEFYNERNERGRKSRLPLHSSSLGRICASAYPHARGPRQEAARNRSSLWFGNLSR